MKRIFVLILICNLFLLIFAHELIFNSSKFDELIFEENSFECRNDFFNKHRDPKLSIIEKFDLYSMPENKLVDAGYYDLNISISKFNYQNELNEINLSGQITGDWNSQIDTIMIFVGDVISGEETVYWDYSIETTDRVHCLLKTINMRNPQIFQTHKVLDNNKKQLFDIEFKIQKNYFIIFGVNGCTANIYNIGKLINGE